MRTNLSFASPRLSRAALLLSLALAVAPACEDDNPPADADGGRDGASDGAADLSADRLSDGGTADGGADASGDGLDGGDDGGGNSDASGDGGGGAFLPAPAGIIVLSSDRTSTSIGLTGRGGRSIVKDKCLHSGSASPLLSAALSGDVVLPTDLQPDNEVVAIDRENGTLTWVAPANCEVLRQMNAGAGFASNPYDLIAVPGGKGYVTRYNLNPGNPAEGSDILIVDTTKAQAIGRIDLRPYVTATMPPAKALLPFPTRGVLIGDKVYVALNHFSSDYSATGIGRLVAIDTRTDTVVETIDLPGLKNCGVLRPLGAPGTQAFVVGCSGPFSDGPAQINSAGIAWIDVGVTPTAVTVLPSTPFGRPVSGFDITTINDSLAATVVPGAFGMAPFDAVWTFDVVGFQPQKLYEADSSFTLAVGSDPGHRLLYVLDAAKSEPLVHVFEVHDNGDPTIEIASFASSPATGLPPRHFALY